MDVWTFGLSDTCSPPPVPISLVEFDACEQSGLREALLCGFRVKNRGLAFGLWLLEHIRWEAGVRGSGVMIALL